MENGKCMNCNTDFRYAPYRTKGIYCSNKCQGKYQIKQRFVKGTRFKNSMRKYLVETREYKCDECGVGEIYNGKPLSLQVDHIDGDVKNNEHKNLRFLCPNCHTQTSTWGIGNMSEEGLKRLKRNLV